MRKTSLLSLAVILGLAGLSRADFNYVGRYVGVRVGPNGVEVRAPFVNVFVPKGMNCPAPVPMPRADPVENGPPVRGPEGVPLKIAPPVPPIPLPEREPEDKLVKQSVEVPSIKQSAEVPSIYEFAASFKPTAGTHDVTVIHPYTNRPVKLSFSLPEGSPKVQVKGALRRCIDFEYGKSHREIWFYRDGRVKLNF
jgi:hypothetical protein